MALTFDTAKNDRNVLARGLSFYLVEDLDWDAAQVKQDLRKDYGEARLRVLAFLGDRLHTAIVSPRGNDLRVISFRKANKREMKEYAKNLGVSGVAT